MVKEHLINLEKLREYIQLEGGDPEGNRFLFLEFCKFVYDKEYKRLMEGHNEKTTKFTG